jgi:hypothetical protein
MILTSMTATLYENDDFSQRRKDAKDKTAKFFIHLGDLGDFARDIFMLRCVRKEMIVGMTGAPDRGRRPVFPRPPLRLARPGGLAETQRMLIINLRGRNGFDVNREL